MKIRLLLLIGGVGPMCLGGCAHVNQASPQEVVLKPGMEVSFYNTNGSGTITYVSPLERRYSFDGNSYTIPMIPRSERFLGEMGIYNPAARGYFDINPDPRIVASEAELHFNSLEEARKQMVEGSAIEDWVYNDEGYVVGYSKSPQRNDQSTLRSTDTLSRVHRPRICPEQTIAKYGWLPSDVSGTPRTSGGGEREMW